ncbi:MAG: hypothetical protein KDA88_02550 [Planctomycetaceae bacterium]|nr:hypothetical protein [Planctomycetaceae bacterium]MCB9952123.1 hypothetical protein [Planctomycetaceae bacterium]
MSEQHASAAQDPVGWGTSANEKQVTKVARQAIGDQFKPGPALLAVGRRYSEMTYLPHSIGRECVAALLIDAGFPRIPDRLFNSLIDQVSRSLHDDPISLARLQRIWETISCPP